MKKILFFSIVFLLFFYVFSLPSFSDRVKLNYISYAVIILLGVSSLLYLILYSKISFDVSLFIMPAFATWALVGTILYSHQFRAWLTLILLSLTIFVLYWAFLCINDFCKTIQIVVGALFCFSIYFIIHYLAKGVLFSGARIGDDFANVNTIGAYMTIGIGAALYLIMFKFRKLFLFFIVPILFFFVIGFLTGSKTFVICTFILIIVLLFVRLKKHKIVFLISLVALIGAAFGLLQLPMLATIKTRLLIMLGTFFGSNSDTSTTTRALWQLYAVTLGSGNLLVGYGSNGFNIYSGVGSYSHGNFAEVICNFGLPGLFLFYSIPFYCLFVTIKKREFHPFVIAFGIYLFITGFFSVNYYGKAVFLIISLLILLISREREKQYGKVSFLY